MLIFAGQSTLPESCPVCTHQPLSAEDCIPQKSLRLTCKAFLKSETKKRNKPKEEPAPASISPALQPTSNSTTDATLVAEVKPEPTANGNASASTLPSAGNSAHVFGGNEDQTIRRPSVEVRPLTAAF